MALQIALPRAFDAAGNIVTDAVATFFNAGSTSPIVVYADKNLNDPRGDSVEFDANGTPPQCWVENAAAVKVDIVSTASGVSIPGYPIDNHGVFPEANGAASNVAFTAFTPNTEATVQEAIEANVTRINTLDNASRIPVSVGSGGSFSITPQNTVSAYAAGQAFDYVANQASVGGGVDTLNVGGVGATVIKKYDGTAAKVDLTASDIAIGDTVSVKNDGTHWIFLGSAALNVASFSGDAIETSSEGLTASDTALPTSAAVLAELEIERTAINTTTGGTEIDFSTLPAAIDELKICFQGLSLSSGTTNFLFQIGDSGGFEVTGYISTSQSAGVGAISTAGFIGISDGEPTAHYGVITLLRVSGNTWAIDGHLTGSSTNVASCAGTKTLSGELTQVRITSTNGTDTFDVNGGVSLVYK